MTTAKGDCLLVNVQLKDADKLIGMLSKPTEKDGFLVWDCHPGLRKLRKQVQFNAIADKTAWMTKD